MRWLLLTLRRQDNKYYKQVHSQVLQDVLLRLDKAYQAFFKKIAKYPKFKRKEKYNSFTYPQYGNGWKIKNNKLVLSCIGAIDFKLHRIPVGTLKRCTIIRDVDQWYWCITVKDWEEKPHQKQKQKQAYDTTKAVGIDVGLTNWLTLSDGKVLQNTLNIEAQARKIKQLQKNLSRKQKGSKNREKARIVLAKVWQKIRRCRDDFVHKTSKLLAADSSYTFIVFEKLNINNMVKNHHLAKAIMDMPLGQSYAK